jgi:putative transposase
MTDASRLHARRSVRLRNHDYRAGSYLVTICTHVRLPLLGTAVDAAVVLSAVGRVVAAYWTAIPAHFPSVTLDAWAIRPDHLHGILVLTGRGDACVAPTASSHRHGPPRQSLPAIVGAFKSAVTRQVNQLRLAPGRSIWQRGYYEQILWDADARQRAREYVRDQQSV